ncbi:hypothetical protein SNE40_020378 [Patella caerulea]|uniref:Uncharacterized protein n=1 Tax=Patella caerulea TaxID=87958 RepID=A0AAN8GHP5_PATCE
MKILYILVSCMIFNGILGSDNRIWPADNMQAGGTTEDLYYQWSPGLFDPNWRWTTENKEVRRTTEILDYQWLPGSFDPNWRWTTENKEVRRTTEILDSADYSKTEGYGEQSEDDGKVINDTDIWLFGIGGGGVLIIIVTILVLTICCKRNKQPDNGTSQSKQLGISKSVASIPKPRKGVKAESNEENLYSSTHEQRTGDVHIYTMNTSSDYVILC